ncbi:MAG: pilus assembly PilX N-terminal domain-containing protein [Deltaproteobacteria bacterium]|nr:pilus assembly PilX N-terminal domain-containing protein [Deltaproteobacteria bacterium]
MTVISKDERGFAMVTAIFVMAMLIGVTAAALRMSQSDIAASRNYRGSSQSLFAAEAGVAHAVGIINQAGVINLQNDVYGVWTGHQAPFGASPQPMAQQAGYFYSVSIAMDPYRPGDPNRGVLTATGTGSDNSLRTVVARIVKSGVPAAPPGAIYLATDNPTDATFNGNNFEINGNDVNYSNGLAGPKPAVPGITTRTEANAQETRDSLSNQQKDNVQGLGYIPGNPDTPSVSATQGMSSAQINQMITDLLALPHTTWAGDIHGGDTLGTSTPPPGHPQITYLPGNGSGVTENGNASGAGIMIVENALNINGNFNFDGLIIVRGTTQVTDVTGSATIFGSIWTTDFNLTVGGHADIQYSSEALALANQSGSGVPPLPAPVVVTSWRDVF